MLLSLRLPADNQRGPLYLDLAFATLHQANSTREPLTFLCARQGDEIGIFCRCSDALGRVVASQLSAAYPDGILRELPDTALEPPTSCRTWSVDLLLKPDLFPLRRYVEFEDTVNRVTADPLAAVLAALSHETAASLYPRIEIQVVPARHRHVHRARRALERLSSPFFLRHAGLADWYAHAATTDRMPLRLVAWLVATGAQAAGDTLSTLQLTELRSRLAAAVEKLSEHLFECRLHIVVAAPTSAEPVALAKLTELVGVIRAFAIPNRSAFVRKNRRSGKWRRKGFLLSTSELATLWHPATVTVRVPKLESVGSREREPPAALRLPGRDDAPAILGRMKFRDRQDLVALAGDDRRRHLNVIGKTGMGKSALLENLIVGDVRGRRGVGLVDPHGDLVEAVLRSIPAARTNDVILFDAGDQRYPLALNLLDCPDRRQRPLIASGVVAAFQKLWGESWGPRLEYILRHGILTLLDVPSSTLVTLLRLLSDAPFRAQVTSRVADPLVRSFWENEFRRWKPQMQAEAVAPVLNKVGAYLSSPLLRAIVGQPRSTLNLRGILDRGQVLLVNLSKGRMGEDASALLGSLVVTGLQLAAMSRADQLETERRDFYLYVDEFQNFATQSFAAILSEARKYRLCLTLANQYLDQMDETTRAAVFGNVGSLVCFQVGAADAEFLAEQLGGDLSPADLLSLPKYATYVRLLVEGLPSRPFSVRTLPPPIADQGTQRAEIVRRTSRQRYGRPAARVETEIRQALVR